MWSKTITGNFAGMIHGLNASQLTDQVLRRSKRMILDTLGVGLLGSSTEVCHKVIHYSKIYSTNTSSTVWGHSDVRLPPLYAAFANGVAVHSMDFDDTWHPATHPSGTVLPSLVALSDTLSEKKKISGLDLLLAFNVGIEVQGRLLRFSSEAHNIPKRFHPPSVVGTMGSAAAVAKLLAFDQFKCKEALAIAASYAGAPMANAATQTKPLHIGNAARHGLEAACLASLGLQGNNQILDMESGLGAFYGDYTPQVLPPLQSYSWLLDQQDVAIKRFPAHLGTHWVADAASSVRKHLVGSDDPLPVSKIKKITLKVPEAQYVNRSFPNSEHEARHSFQFAACTALLDGSISVQSFNRQNIFRPELKELLCKTQMEHPSDNKPSFESLYCEVSITLQDGDMFSERCDTFYGHWRKPLSKEDLEKKFRSNASSVLSLEATEGIIETVNHLEEVEDCMVLSEFLKGTQSTQELPQTISLS
ncbi:cis-aconitate decarboxylase [Alligator sinensis]|uniref:Cis-aconitate decarboxylase n=1 Tax=Alligator sinensis TaxID=38654 RepID=A0A1U7SCX2_ALLSI|nr:cis-aconitate decarboxylase [Alligator sinensis]XP_025070917.1 cis-aconitate decarboxylase [Alligator sinensis]XP_025070918.1 cis-aconitate decarboxylase [Alligator sinensis]XP_025070919.1 cis-aconitate decarboxylase [Alligator sinensis]